MIIKMSGVVAVGVAMGLALGALSSRPGAQAQAEVRIGVVEYPRALSVAVRQVEERFGRVVTYEDGSYVAPEDTVDVAEKVRSDGTMTRRRREMRGDSIDLVYTPTGASVDAQVGEALARLIAQWNRPAHSGRFRVDRVKGGYHVVPVARKGQSGSAEPYTSPLDATITISSDERDGLEAMTVLAEAISRSSGRLVVEGTMPTKLLKQAKVVLGADDQPAREILWKLLQAIDPALSWQVLCEAGEDSMCAINIHHVGAADGE